MWFIGVEVEQETSAPPLKKKSWIRLCEHSVSLITFNQLLFNVVYVKFRRNFGRGQTFI